LNAYTATLRIFLRSEDAFYQDLPSVKIKQPALIEWADLFRS